MRYDHIVPGTFRSRPNRFIAHVDLGGETAVCHVKNTGRCRELLVPGAAVYVQDFGPRAAGRKTRYDLIAVEKERPVGPLLINMDAQAPNKVFAEWAQKGGFRPGLTLLRPETVFGTSRFDFYYEAAGNIRGFVEVKGVTLEENGLALFPDAPTQRGVKHLEELVRARTQGYAAHVCFVVQMAGMRSFSPNDTTHPAFGEALRRAVHAGVDAFAVECAVTRETLEITENVPMLSELEKSKCLFKGQL